MKVRIITIGDEILFGQVIDTNSTYIAQKLSEIGLTIKEIRSIRDQPQIIIDTLNQLVSKSDIIITTGGLGPTKDDLTKKALCEFLGTELVMDNEVFNQIETRFKKINLKMNGLNRDQALMPKGSTALFNPLGTAPGIWTEYQNCIIINLAGVPFEMKNLIKTEVIPRLKERYALPYVVHRFLSVSNYPESELAIALEEWEDDLPTDMHLAYLPERSKVKLRITAIGKDREELDNRIETEVQKIIPLLGKRLDSAKEAAVEAILGEVLKKKGLTISTAESCTGGNIAHLLTSVSGSSAYYKGSVVSYATEVKENILEVPKETIENYTVVSEEVAIAMAEGVRLELNTNIGLSTTGVAGPAKGEDGKDVGTVWIAVSSSEKTITKSYFLPYLERDDFISQVSKLALQMVFKFISK